MSWSVFDYAAWRDRLIAHMPPPEPRAKPEWERLAEEIIDARADLVSDDARDDALRREYVATRRWPDPYGPDPVVFGSVPRFRNPFSD